MNLAEFYGTTTYFEEVSFCLSTSTQTLLKNIKYCLIPYPAVHILIIVSDVIGDQEIAASHLPQQCTFHIKNL